MADYNIRFGYPISEVNPTGEPLPTQKAFHASKEKYRLLAGGFATGKTTAICLEVIKELLKYNNNYGVLGRKDLGELKSTTLKELLDLLPVELIANHNKSDKVIKLLNGSELYYMNLDDSRAAVEKIKSLNLGFVAIDQLEEINEPIFLAFQGRLRRQNSSRNFFASMNPAGHDWIYYRWKAEEKKGYALFEAITLENKYLPKDYVDELLSYPDRWVKRYVFCSWDDFEGIVYSEFIEKKHKIAQYIPADSEKKYIVLDYGFRNPTAILYCATDFDGITRIYDEYYETGKLVSELSEEIKKNKRGYSTLLIDPSTKNRQRDGFSVWDEFLQNKIYFQKANNDVRQGINRVNELFKRNKLYICANCENTLKEIGNYKWKAIKEGAETNEYEEPTKKDDHAMDALRYLANEIYTPERPKPPKEYRLPSDIDEYKLDEVTL